ncbi:MAG: hypothetical protein V3U08_07490, partial [Nitrospirales bacterium]
APTEAAVRQAHGHEPVEWHEMLWFENPFDMLKAPRGLAGLTTLSPVDGPLHGPTSVTCYLFFAPVIKATKEELATMKSG